ncbi:DUF4188 domain-containing protein [Kineococcus sp. SYSU DK004]|uniref:DUF4188 domain-containing protein n=1 Tax=Kineococcus sp. SYSU DK004 TaxID=3383125 RepID=UPI003D7C7E3E
MAQVQRGRRTARLDEDGAVVFLVGMRINRALDVRRWAPVAAAMPRMLAELRRRPELGLLGASSWASGRTLVVVQYWRSVEHLHAYATARDAEHLPAWRAFNRAARSGDGAVGVFHETYLATPGTCETVYVDMPPHGLAAATVSVPAGPDTDGAVRQLSGSGSPPTRA